MHYYICLIDEKNWGTGGGYLICPWSQTQVVAESVFELRFVWLQISSSFHHNPADSFSNKIQRPTLYLSASENATSMWAFLCHLPCITKNISCFQNILACAGYSKHMKGREERRKGDSRRGRKGGIPFDFLWIKCSRRYLTWGLRDLTGILHASSQIFVSSSA